MAKLIISHEDAAIGHLHAIVGVLNLLVYMWRYSLVLNGDMRAGFGNDISLDIASVCLMALPNLTSFIFVKHVPVENKGDNVTIWKEYRWHNFIFAYQSILLLSINIYEMHSDELINRQMLFYGKAIMVAIRLVCMALATHYNPPKFTTSVRGAYKNAPAFIPFFLSYAQFAGTCIILCWEISTVMHFVAVTGIQLNSFIMTLRKKGKISTTCYLAVYVFLVVSLVVFGFLPPFFEAPSLTKYGLLDERFKPLYMALFTFWVRRQGLNRFATWVIGPSITEATFRVINTYILDK